MKIVRQFIGGKRTAYNPKVPQGTIETQRTQYHKRTVFIRLFGTRDFLPTKIPAIYGGPIFGRPLRDELKNSTT